VKSYRLLGINMYLVCQQKVKGGRASILP